jgi:hypothetical protein
MICGEDATLFSAGNQKSAVQHGAGYFTSNNMQQPPRNTLQVPYIEQSREIIAVYCEKQTKHINIKTRGTDSYHCRINE